MATPSSEKRTVRHWLAGRHKPIYPLLLVLIFITGVIWAITLFEISSARTAALENEKSKNSNLAKSQEDRVLRSLQVLDQALLVLRHNNTRHKADASLDSHITNMKLDRSALGVVSIIGPDGNIVETTAKGQSSNFAEREYFQFHARTKEDVLLVGKPILGKFTGRWLVTLTRRIDKPDGSFGGLVFMAVEPNYFITEYDRTQLGDNAVISLIGLDGISRVRMNNGSLRVGDDLRDAQLFKELPKAPVGTYTAMTAYDGIRRTVSYRKLENYPLVVVVGSSLDSVLAARKGGDAIYLGLALLCTALVAGIGITTNSSWSRIEGALRQARSSEHKFRSIIDVSPIPMAINDDYLNVTYVNPAFTQTFGYRLIEVPTLVQWWPKAYPDPAYREEVKRRWQEELGRAALGRQPFQPLEVNIHCKDGVTKRVLVSADRLSESLAGEHLVVLYDITAQRNSVDALNALVRDKNALLREVHHRVKNNLQVISSLLRLEAHKSQHPQVKTVLSDMNWRIRTMAMLHESLYRTDHYASVDLPAYIRQLSTEIIRAMTSPLTKVNLVLEFCPVIVSMDQATPCGLIVNELISNALKHGFANGRNGTLTIRLTQLDRQTVRLSVSDDGAGLPADFMDRQNLSLGLQLVNDLVVQLKGTLTIGPAPAASFHIDFQPEAV